MQLHEELGPKNTTISAVAERAGVQRLTVYRHFPDETALFQACTSHWLTLNPPPNPDGWARIEGGVARCRAALMALYGYFRTTRSMWRVAYRDVEQVPALQGPMAEIAAYLSSVADGLAEPFGASKPPPHEIAVTLRHAVQFASWASLADQGLTDDEAADLVCAWLNGLNTTKGNLRRGARARRGPLHA